MAEATATHTLVGTCSPGDLHSTTLCAHTDNVQVAQIVQIHIPAFKVVTRMQIARSY